MKELGGRTVARALVREGVNLVFGIPGTHNIELYDAMLDEPKLTPILVGDEQAAGFMADGAFRASGRLAALNLVPGAGLTHALSGIAECWMDQIPLLVIACGIRGDTGRAYQLHDINQAEIARPVCKRVFQARTHADLDPMIRDACRLAVTAPAGPVMIEVPAELYISPGDPGPEVNRPLSDASLNPVDPALLGGVADALNRSRSIGLYLGLGAQSAGNALMELAEALDAVVFTTISGKGVFPENHPRWTWNQMGRTAPASIRQIESGLDCLLAIGCRFGEVATGSYGVEPPARLIHVDADAAALGRNYPAEVTIQADAGAFVRALLSTPSLAARQCDSARLNRLAAAHACIREEQAAPLSKDRIAPEALFSAAQRAAGPEAIYVTDSGNGTFLAMEHLRLPRPRSFLAPVDYSCMGYCVPAAIGASLAEPARPVVAFAGDGAFMMTGFELATASAQGVGLVVILLRDGELSQIAQFQRAALQRETCTELPSYRADLIAEGLGAAFLRLDPSDPESGIRWGLAEAARGRPVLLEAAVDYSMPTYFSKGVLKTNFLRFPWKDRLRLVARVVGRKITSAPR
ncbi:MAG: thiamine pyrophosphate-binding protein [Bdellovibrionales bacterium]|nr:thiamine pyrophosphate-binding protein [Bdellovibrionales bacterium]